MIEPRPAVTQFLKAVALVERARGGGARDFDVAQTIMTRLNHALVELVGSAGFDILLARALVLARRAHPVLAGVTSAPGGILAGLDVPARDGAEVHQGAMAIVAHFIELLAVLIGEDLAMRLVHDVWPAEKSEQ